MEVLIRRMFAAAAVAALVTGSIIARAEGPAPAQAAAPTVQEQAVSRAMSGIATALLLQVAAGMAGGSMSDLDPGPAIEQALKGALASREVDRLIDTMMAQAAGSADGGGMSPQMRAALALVVRQALATARREMAAESRRD